jgi:rubrerythrin
MKEFDTRYNIKSKNVKNNLIILEGKGELKPNLLEEGLGANQAVLWKCNNCDYQTRLTFSNKQCPGCSK